MQICQTYKKLGIILLVALLCIIPSMGEDIAISANYTSNDTQFLFNMNQYWIPDLYEIKGRIDGAVSYDLPDMLNISVDYADIRLKKNLNETLSYNVSADLVNLRTVYARTVTSELPRINHLPLLNRSDPSYFDQVSGTTARLSLYGSWLEYQVMQRYTIHNRTFPDIATVPAEEFFSIMANLT